MEREYKDLLVNEPDGGVYFELVDRAGKTALGPVRARLKSPVKQPGDRWTAAAANLLLRLDEAGRPRLAIPPKAVGGLSRCSHKKAGGVHELAGEGENLRFVASADLLAGDRFTLNGRAVSARTLSGEPLWPGYFKAGAVVVCHQNGDVLTFSGGGGLGSADKKTVEAFLPETKSVLGGSVRGTVPVLGEKRWIPAASDQQIPQNRYTGGAQIIAGDSRLRPENIRKGVSLFDVHGSYDGPATGPAAGSVAELSGSWKAPRFFGVNPLYFVPSGNGVTAQKAMNIRLTVTVWASYLWDSYQTVEAGFLVGGVKRASCTLRLAAEAQGGPDNLSHTVSETVHLEPGTHITMETTPAAGQIVWKTYGGALGQIEVV